MLCSVTEWNFLSFRYYVVYKVPGLKFLDSSQVTPSEVQEAKRVGPYQQIVRPKDNLEVSTCEISGPY